MKYYIGVKLVQAEQCLKLTKRVRQGYDVEVEYKCISWSSPISKEYEAELGYMVTYQDGYKSFCPKTVFEKYNFEVGEKPKVEDEMVERFVVAVHTGTGFSDEFQHIDIEGANNCHKLAVVNTEQEQKEFIEEAKREFKSWLNQLVMVGLNGFRKPNR